MDSDPMSFEKLSEGFSGYTFVGDATDMSLLEEAYITSTREIIITTGDDNTNVFLALVARKIYNVPQIYVRLDDAIYPFKLSLEEFLDIREKNDGGLKK